MKYKDKEINTLTDQELLDASFYLNKTENDLADKRADPRFVKKMQNQPEAPINPVFLALKAEITNEIANRKLTP